MYIILILHIYTNIHTAKEKQELENTLVTIESTKTEIKKLEAATKELGDVLQSNKAKVKLSQSKLLDKEVVH